MMTPSHLQSQCFCYLSVIYIDLDIFFDLFLFCFFSLFFFFLFFFWSFFFLFFFSFFVAPHLSSLWREVWTATGGGHTRCDQRSLCQQMKTGPKPREGPSLTGNMGGRRKLLKRPTEGVGWGERVVRAGSDGGEGGGGTEGTWLVRLPGDQWQGTLLSPTLLTAPFYLQHTDINHKYTSYKQPCFKQGSTRRENTDNSH